MSGLLATVLLLVLPVPEEAVEVEVWVHRQHLPGDLRAGQFVDIDQGWVYPRPRKDGVAFTKPTARRVEVVAVGHGESPLDARLTVRVRLRATKPVAETIRQDGEFVMNIVERHGDEYVTTQRMKLLYLDRVPVGR